MNRRIFLKYGITTTAGMALSLENIHLECSHKSVQQERFLGVIRKYGGEFGGMKFEKEDENGCF